VKKRFLITCEHGGNRIPSRYKAWFTQYTSLLQTHWAYDPGALRMAQELSSAMDAPLYASTVSRLLIDLNRSITHPHVFSEATRAAPKPVREEIRRRYYDGYRGAVEQQAASWVMRDDRVIHISCHSFTPELNGKRRNADIGLLYDPTRAEEPTLCRLWRDAINMRLPELKVRMNYPYAGNSDGLTTFLRKRFSSASYLGIELEINQSLVCGGARQWKMVRQAVIDALRTASESADDAGRTTLASQVFQMMPVHQV
jgi:predicted N-formylglutamate amidohydrolase